MKTGKCILMILVWLGLCNASFAVEAAPVGRALIYIDPREYTNEIKLWHFYYSYWFSQGKAVEPLALDALAPLFAETAMCEGNSSADIVIWIKPRMFYNPHMTTFYGKIVAKAYSGSGKPVATYKAEVKRLGMLDVLPVVKVRETYAAAMQEIVRQMKADSALQTLIAQGLPGSETKMPCAMVTILPTRGDYITPRK